MAVHLTAEQRDAVECRGRDLLVSAAAGSGKTRVLVERLMARICGPERRNLEDFLLITFTNAAAAEMRDRIYLELSERFREHPSDRHLRRQLAAVGRANIMTIDALCLQILREFPHLSALRPGFRIVSDAEGELIRAEATDLALERLYGGMTKEFTALAALFAGGRSDRRLVKTIVECHRNMQSHPFPEAWAAECIARFEDAGSFDGTVWAGTLLADAREAVQGATEALDEAARLLAEEPELAAKYLPTIEDDRALAGRLLIALEGGWDAAVAALDTAPGKLNSAPRGYGDPAFRDHIKALRQTFKDCFEGLSGTIASSAADNLAECRRLAPAVRGLFQAAEVFEEEYGRLKGLRGVADFSDIAHEAVRLLCDRSSGVPMPSDVAEVIGRRFAEVMVDEYQDTNGIQELIIKMLTDGRDNLFLVGDVKQSIYRFRLAEPGLFLARYRASPPLDRAEGSAARVVLSQNFRSRPEITDAVNFVFSGLMRGGFTEVSYDADAHLRCGRAVEPDDAHLPELHIIDVPRGSEEEHSPEKAEVEARFVASRIRELMREGFRVPEGEGDRPLAYRDIAILLRSASGKTEVFERVLGAADIPTYSERGKAAMTTEVAVVLSFLRVVDNPDQDVALVSVLRSPLYDCPPDTLAEIRAARKGSFYGAVKAAARAGNEICGRLLADLPRYRAIAADFGAFRLLNDLYAETGLCGIYGAMPGGAARRRKLLLLAEHARRYDEGNGAGVYGLAEYLETLLEKGGFGGVASEAGDAVRIMTIHGAKGLEFPVVFLADLSKKFNLEDLRGMALSHPRVGIGLKQLDADRLYCYPTASHAAVAVRLKEETLAEEMRILYVAMTRAREKLILTCAYPDAQKKLASLFGKGGLLSMHALGTASGPDRWLLPVLACHPSAAVLREFAPYARIRAEAVGGWRVSVARERDASPEGAAEAAHETPAQSSAPDETDWAPLIRERLAYRYPHMASAELPSKLTATQIKGRMVDEELLEDAAAPPDVRRPPARPRFLMAERGLTPTERGTALHIAMQFADFGRLGDEESAARELARLCEMRILSDEQAAVVEPRRMAAFMASPLGQRIQKSIALRREFKFSVLEDASVYYPELPAGEDTVLVQGVCDLFFEEPDGLVVVDFKTDRVSEGTVATRAEEYRPQLTVYGDALHRITGKPVKERLLYFFAIDRAVPV